MFEIFIFGILTFLLRNRNTPNPSGTWWWWWWTFLLNSKLCPNFLYVEVYFSFLQSSNFCCSVVKRRLSSHGVHYLFVFILHGAITPSGPGLPHFRGVSIALRHTPLGRTPLNELSARWQHNGQTPMPSAGFEPAIPASELTHTHVPVRAATGVSIFLLFIFHISSHLLLFFRVFSELYIEW